MSIYNEHKMHRGAQGVIQSLFLYSACVFGHQSGIALVYWVLFVKTHRVLWASNAQCVRVTA